MIILISIVVAVVGLIGFLILKNQKAGMLMFGLYVAGSTVCLWHIDRTIEPMPVSQRK